jgi:membrane-associated protein
MNFILSAIDFVLHIDTYLDKIITRYGPWTYGLLFFVIFMETGFVVTPFLPGDSLLFAAGTFAARGVLSPWLLFILMAIAAVAGDTANYWIGHAIGVRAFTGEIKWLKKEYLDRTHAFFEKHGGKTIFLARFVPIIRTFAPFVAGVGEMTYGYFISYNIFGGTVWVALFTFTGYFFGNIPLVRNNFELVIVVIVLISLVPVLVEWWKARNASKNTQVTKNRKSIDGKKASEPDKKVVAD